MRFNANELLDNIDFIIKTDSDKYYFKDKAVPRVSDILSATLYEEYLMKWANSLGYKHIDYKKALSSAAEIGTRAHNTIETFLSTGIKEDNFVPFDSFLMWWNDINTDNKLSVLGIEQTVVCEWFGGTYDLLMSINDNIYLIDFKTSNNISYKHWLQLSAYKYMLSTIDINIDGCIILQLDKNIPSYEEYGIRFNNEKDYNFINNCTDTFMAMTYQYYNIKHIKEFEF